MKHKNQRNIKIPLKQYQIQNQTGHILKQIHTYIITAVNIRPNNLNTEQYI